MKKRCFEKNTGSLMNYKELICLQQKSYRYLQLKKGLLYEWKKDLEESLGEKYLSGKPVHFSVKNTANDADTWGFIQQFFQHLYWTANSIVYLINRVETENILRYRQQHISPEEYSTAGKFYWQLVVKVETAQIHRYRQQHISLGEVQHSSKILWGICSLFPLNCREQQWLKTNTSSENSQGYKNYIFYALWLQPKKVILSAGGVISKKSHYFLPSVTTIKVPSKKMFPLQ